MSEYTCELCHETFERTRSDEDALAESRKLFGEVEMSELAIVCDDCFKKLEPMWLR